MTNLENNPSNSIFTEADIALFPIVEKLEIQDFFHLNVSKHKKNLLGIADLPPMFAHRINLFNENGRTFICKNHPLIFSVFDTTRDSTPPFPEYWNQVIRMTREGSCPRIWVLAPQFHCEYAMNEYVKDTAGFYYHDPVKQKGHNYYAVTNSDKIRTHILFSTS